MSHNEMCTHNVVVRTAGGGPKSICYAKYGIEKVSVILFLFSTFGLGLNLILLFFFTVSV